MKIFSTRLVSWLVGCGVAGLFTLFFLIGHATISALSDYRDISCSLVRFCSCSTFLFSEKKIDLAGIGNWRQLAYEEVREKFKTFFVQFIVYTVEKEEQSWPRR